VSDDRQPRSSTRTTPQGSATAAKILEAAREEFATRGFSGASAGGIANRAGVKKALVFYYFGSKAALFELILQRYYESQQRAFEGAFTAAGTLRERLHRLIDAYLDFMIDNHRYPALVQREIAEASVGRTYIERGLAQLNDWLSHALAEVVPPTGPLASKHFYLTFTGILNVYWVYAPAIGTMWGTAPLTVEAQRERCEHVHWMVDAVLAALEVEPVDHGAPTFDQKTS